MNTTDLYGEFRMILSHAFLGSDTYGISKETWDLAIGECVKYVNKILSATTKPVSPAQPGGVEPVMGNHMADKCLRWVKVESEKDLPTEEGNQWLTEWVTDDDPMVVHTDYCSKWDIVHHFKTPEIGRIRYLIEGCSDSRHPYESPTPQLASPVHPDEGDAVEFAEWIIINGYKRTARRDEFSWFDKDVTTNFTTEQLYNLFLQSKQKQP